MARSRQSPSLAPLTKERRSSPSACRSSLSPASPSPIPKGVERAGRCRRELEILQEPFTCLQRYWKSDRRSAAIRAGDPFSQVGDSKRRANRFHQCDGARRVATLHWRAGEEEAVEVAILNRSCVQRR